MVEPLKLVMEQREVKWETTFGTVGPYTFRSFFSVNYNVRTAGAQDYWTTIGDPNFAALEDRMLLRFHPMTRGRFRAVEAAAERLELGELDFELAGRIRDHLTLVHADPDTAPARRAEVPGARGPPRAVPLRPPPRDLRARPQDHRIPEVLAAAQEPRRTPWGGRLAADLLRPPQ